VERILQAALEAVDPAQAVARHLSRQGDTLTLAGQDYDLSRIRRVYLVGAGKAGAPMALQAAALLGARLTAGLVVVKDGHLPAAGEAVHPMLEFVASGHPIPDERGVRAAGRMMALLRAAGEDDLVLCVISGGGSALLNFPAEGISLADLQSLTAQLLACGANILEINTLRKRLDQLKGGQLARLAYPARLAALILSDVIGDPLEVIASGLTAPDPSASADALRILQRYDLLAKVPTAILDRLKTAPETPKPGDPLFARVQNVLVGSNRQAAQAALRQAQAEGFHTLLLTTWLQGEARQAGRFLAAVARELALAGQPLPRPACLIAGGETTVTLQGSGLGGRNQELALGAVEDFAGLDDALLLSLATDGGDGPTDAAGAWVDGATLSRARALGMHPAAYLARSDAYHFFNPLGGLIVTGPTRTNVNDLALVLTW
jgi:hydroxypyruvate reductase